MAADYPERASALMREVVLDFVRSYLNGGNSALGDYNDKPYKLNLADEFRSLLQPTAYMYGYGAEFHKYLWNFRTLALAMSRIFFTGRKRNSG